MSRVVLGTRNVASDVEGLSDLAEDDSVTEVTTDTCPHETNEASAIPADTVGLWTFESDVPTQPDLSGVGNDASVTAASWIEDPEYVGVMEFQGESFHGAADSGCLSITSDTTVAAWVNKAADVDSADSVRRLSPGTMNPFPFLILAGLLVSEAFGDPSQDGLDLTRSPEPIALECFDVLGPGNMPHPVTVYFEGEDWRLNFFDDDDLRVIGQGFETTASFVDYDVVQRLDGVVVQYLIQSPNGGWSEAHQGNVHVWSQPKQIARIGSGPLPEQLLGTFQVCFDQVVPIEVKRFDVVPGGEGVLIGSGLGTPSEVRSERWVRVVVPSSRDYYVPDFVHRPGEAGLVQRIGDVWSIDLPAIGGGNIARLPEWYSISDIWGPFLEDRRSTRFPFQPLPGEYTLELRGAGQVLATIPFTEHLRGKIGELTGELIVEPSAQMPTVTIKYWHPDGILMDSLGKDDLSLDSFYAEGRQPNDADVRFLGATMEPDGWLTGRYAIPAPDDGWTIQDNGRFFVTCVPGAIQTQKGEPLVSNEGVRVSGFTVGISPPETAPFRISDPEIFKVVHGSTITLRMETNEGFDLASFDSTDLEVEGATIEFLGVSNYGQLVVASYKLYGLDELTLQHAIDTSLDIVLPPDAITTASGISNAIPIIVGTVPLGLPHHLPSRLVEPGLQPLRVSIRFRPGWDFVDVEGWEPPDLEAVALGLRVNEWASDQPPMPFRQLARMVNVRRASARGDAWVDYEIPAPTSGWSHHINGELFFLDSTSDIARANVFVDIPKPPIVSTSISVSQDRQRALGKATLQLDQGDRPWTVTDWRTSSEDNGLVYIDAIASPLEDIFPGPWPETTTHEHTAILYDFATPLASLEFPAQEVVLRVNGEEHARETYEPSIPPTEAIFPVDWEMEFGSGGHSVDITFTFAQPKESIVVINWGEFVIEGEHIRLEGAEFRAWKDASNDATSVFGTHHHLPDDRPESYALQVSMGDQLLWEQVYIGNSFFDWWREGYIDRLGGFAGFVLGGERRVFGDLDADGFSDFEEFAFGSHPIKASDQPFLPRAISDPDTGQVGIHFYWPRDRESLVYQLQLSSDLKTWSPQRDLVRSTWPSDPNHKAFLDPDSLPDDGPYYLRVKVFQN